MTKMESQMIINNRDKIQSEVSTKKYRDNWDRIFRNKNNDKNKSKADQEKQP
jgi:hypothetical protein